MAQQVPGDIQGAVAQACCPPRCASAWVPVDASWARELLTHAACRAARAMERGSVQVCGAATPARRGHPVPARHLKPALAVGSPITSGAPCSLRYHVWPIGKAAVCVRPQTPLSPRQSDVLSSLPPPIVLGAV